MPRNDIEAPPGAYMLRPQGVRAMRPSHLAAHVARPEDHDDKAAAILAAWLAPRVSSRRRFVPNFKRLMRL